VNISFFFDSVCIVHCCMPLIFLAPSFPSLFYHHSLAGLQRSVVLLICNLILVSNFIFCLSPLLQFRFQISRRRLISSSSLRLLRNDLDPDNIVVHNAKNLVPNNENGNCDPWVKAKVFFSFNFDSVKPSFSPFDEPSWKLTFINLP
jgi:hypothetical protein